MTLSPGEERFVAALREHPEGLTTADCYEVAGTLRPSARVYDLKAKGITVEVLNEGLVNGKARFRYRLVNTGKQAEMFTRTPWNPVALGVKS